MLSLMRVTVNIQRHHPITINITTVTREEAIHVRDLLLQPLLRSCILSNSLCRCKMSSRGCIWLQREFRAMNKECHCSLCVPPPRPLPGHAVAPRPYVPKLVRGSNIWRPESRVGAPMAPTGSRWQRPALGARVEAFPHAGRAGFTHRQRLAPMGHPHVSSMFAE